MSASVPAQAASLETSRPHPAVPPWLREPLLHFLILGACVFGIDRIVADQADDPKVITVSPAVDAEVRAVFAEARKRDPNASEMDALRRVWLDNEVLYREGLAMQLDKGDTTIRDRVIFKALSAIEANLKLPAMDDKALQAWFERNRTKYDEPVRFDFQEAVLPTDTPESSLHAFAAALDAGAPGDMRASLDAFRTRPRPTVVQSYGEDFAKALEASTPGEWRVLKAKDRLRVIRLETMLPARPAEFESIRNAVTADWVDATMAEMRSAAVKNLATKYTIKGFEASRP